VSTCADVIQPWQKMALHLYLLCLWVSSVSYLVQDPLAHEVYG